MTAKRVFSKSMTAAVLLACLSALAPGRAYAEDRPAIGLKSGQMYPDFLLPTLDGELRRLSDYPGKKILLFHFASW